MTVYVDVLFVLEWLADMLTLRSAAQAGGFTSGRWRLELASLLGALYGTAAVAGPDWLEHPLWKLMAGGLMTAAAFGWPGWRGGLQRCLAVGAFSALYGGAMMFWQAVFAAGRTAILPDGQVMVQQNFWITVMELLLTHLIFSLVIGQIRQERIRGRSVYMVKIVRGERSCVLKGLVDTGNGLTDPGSGAPVAVTSYPSIRGLFSPEERKALKLLLRMQGGTDVPGEDFHLVSYTTMGGAGKMPVFRPDAFYVEEDGRYAPVEQVVIGVGQQPPSGDGSYDMLLQLRLVESSREGGALHEANQSHG
ncbi:MAG: sigma-E processing peptidase SpoIIGA [Eubacteriales bacterium]|jgi:sigma-E processing peptidase SpoIIGA